MRSLLNWALPVVAAFALVFGIATLSAKAADDAKSVITGKVVDKDGAAVADAAVTLTKPRDPNAAQGTRPEPLATATSDKDGKFKLEFDKAKVADGDYSVSARVQGKGMGRQAVKVAGGKSTPAEVELKLAARQRPAAQ